MVLASLLFYVIYRLALLRIMFKSRTYFKYVKRLDNEVTNKIKSILDHFKLIFDGWCSGTVHYVAIS